MNFARTWRVTLSFGIVLAIWWTTSGTIFVEEIVPKPPDVLRQFIEMVESHEILHARRGELPPHRHRLHLGVHAGAHPGGHHGRDPARARHARPRPLEFFRNIPPIAMVPVVISIFGIGEMGKYFIISYATTIVMIINTAAGVTATPRIRIRAAQCLGADRWSIFLRIVLPSAWPYILTGLRIALGFAFTGIVAAEMLAAQEGIGFLIMQSTNIIEPRDMWIGFVLLGTFGLLTDQLLRSVINRLARRHMIAMGR